MQSTSPRPARSAMEAQPRYSRPLLLLFAPTATPSPAPVAPDILTRDAWPATVASPDADQSALAWLNTNAILVLALLVCAFLAAIALHVALQCAHRLAARAWHGYGHNSGDAAPHPQSQEPAPQSPGSSSTKRGAPALSQALPCLAYSAGLELAGSSRAECAICLAEFAPAEQVRVLPRCNHGFHARCIDRWLAARPTCPTCRQPPFDEPDDEERVVAADRARPAPVVAVVRVIVGGGGGRRAETY